VWSGQEPDLFPWSQEKIPHLPPRLDQFRCLTGICPILSLEGLFDLRGDLPLVVGDLPVIGMVRPVGGGIFGPEMDVDLVPGDHLAGPLGQEGHELEGGGRETHRKAMVKEEVLFFVQEDLRGRDHEGRQVLCGGQA